MAIFYVNDPYIVAGQPTGVTTVDPPKIISVGQSQGVGVVHTQLPEQVANSSVASMNLYRATPTTSREKVDNRTIDRNSRWMNLFDLEPEFGEVATYTVTALTADGTESADSDPIEYTPFAIPPPLVTSSSISASALGPIPLLGSDVYIDPVAKEAVVGVNGDLLSVNSLSLLAQDLRTRILTELGELTLHPPYGLFRGRLIGAGQANPKTMAQILHQRVVDAITADPRVYRLDDVVISAPNFDAWTIEYTVYAIGSEDPLNANLVFPYYGSS